MSIVKVISEFIIYILLLSLLGSPFVLVVLYPEQAEQFVRISESLIPWIVILLISVIYVDGIRSLISKIVTTLGRISKFSAGGAALEMHSQEVASNLTPEQAEAIKVAIQNLSNEKQDATNLASHFFLKYVGATIYGSQFRLLENLENSPLEPSQAITFYNQFLSTQPKDSQYSFGLWAKYLTDNFLIHFNPTTGKYEITQAGKNFITQVRNANLGPHSWAH